MPKVSDLYGSGDFIKYEDLKGGTYTRRISQIRTHTFEAEGDKPARTVLILAFLNAQKELQLNGRSARRLAEVFGDDTDTWVGKDVMLMPVPGSQPKFNAVDAYAAPEGAVPSSDPTPVQPVAATTPQPPSEPTPPPLDDSEIPF